jgi:hypothetical protein
MSHRQDCQKLPLEQRVQQHELWWGPHRRARETKLLHLISKKIDTPTCFTRANSISDIPCGMILTLGRTTFTTPMFFDSPVLDNGGAVLEGGGVDLNGGGAVLDGVARLIPTFALFVANFFDTSAFRLSLAT